MSVLPLAPASFRELLRSASAAWPRLIFARVGEGEDLARGMRLGALDALADHHAASWRETELPGGAHVLLVGASEPRTLAAIAGVQRAGLDVALASPSSNAVALAAEATRLDAVAIVGPSELAERLVEAAVLCENVRLIATHGAAAPGALWLDAPPPPPTAPDETDARRAELAAGADIAMEVARELVTRAGLAPGAAVVSLAPLGAPGGLICGALSPLIAGAHVIWQAPFSAPRLIETLAASAPAHLVAPMRVAGELGLAGLLDRARIASLTLIATDRAPLPPFPHRLNPSHILVLRAAPGEAPRLDAADSGETAPPKRVYKAAEIGERHV